MGTFKNSFFHFDDDPNYRLIYAAVILKVCIHFYIFCFVPIGIKSILCFLSAQCDSIFLVERGEKGTWENKLLYTLGVKPATPGHLFVPCGLPFYSPGSPFHAPGYSGASFCALGSIFCTPTS